MDKKRLILRNESGMTLIEIMVSLALIMGIAFVLLEVVRQSATAGNMANQNFDLSGLYTDVDHILGNQTICQQLLKNEITPANGILKDYTTTNQIANGSPTDIDNDAASCYRWTTARLRISDNGTPTNAADDVELSAGNSFDRYSIINVQSARMCENTASTNSTLNAVVVRVDICKGSLTGTGPYVCHAIGPGASIIRKYFFIPVVFNSTGEAMSCSKTSQREKICLDSGGVWDKQMTDTPDDDQCNMCSLTGAIRRDNGTPSNNDDDFCEAVTPSGPSTMTPDCPASSASNCNYSGLNNGTSVGGVCAPGYAGTCSVSCSGGSPTVTSTCAASTAPSNCNPGSSNHCDFPPQAHQGGATAGTCESGYSGSCITQCNNGTVTVVFNSCTPVTYQDCYGSTIDNCIFGNITHSNSLAGTCSPGYEGSCTANCNNGFVTISPVCTAMVNQGNSCTWTPTTVPSSQVSTTLTNCTAQCGCCTNTDAGSGNQTISKCDFSTARCADAGQACSLHGLSDGQVSSIVDECGCYPGGGGGYFDYTYRCQNGLLLEYKMPCWGPRCMCR